MTKQEFLDTLVSRIGGLPPQETERSVAYYGEMIDDRMEDGMTEEQAVVDIGSVEEAVSHILADISLPQLVREKVKPQRALHTWEVVLLIVGSPLWVPLVLAAVVILLALYVTMWAVILSLYAADLAMAVAGVAGVAAGIANMMTQAPVSMLWLIGMGLFAAGLSILLLFVCNRLARLILRGGGCVLLWVKSRFIKKGESA